MQLSLLKILDGIDKLAVKSDAPSNETVGEFVEHYHRCKSRHELLAKLDEIVSIEKSSKIKRK